MAGRRERIVIVSPPLPQRSTLPRGFSGHVAHPVRSIPIRGNQPLKKGLLGALMKIAGLKEDDL